MLLAAGMTHLPPRFGIHLALAISALAVPSATQAGETPVLESLQMPALVASDLDSSTQPGSLGAELVVGQPDPVGTSESTSTGVTVHFGALRLVTVPEAASSALQPVALFALALLPRPNSRRPRKRS